MDQSSNDKKSSTKKDFANFTISSEVGDYSNEPAFVKKTQEAKEFLERVGFPEELLKIRKEMYGK